MDDKDRRIIVQALRQLTDDCTQTPTSTKQTKRSTPTATETARRELLSTFQDDDRDHLVSVFLYPKTLTSLTYYNCYNNYSNVQTCLILMSYTSESQTNIGEMYRFRAINYGFYMWICLYIYSAFFSVRLP